MDGPVFFPLRPSLEPPAVAGRVPLSVVLHEYLQSGWPVVPVGRARKGGMHIAGGARWRHRDGRNRTGIEIILHFIKWAAPAVFFFLSFVLFALTFPSPRALRARRVLSKSRLLSSSFTPAPIAASNIMHTGGPCLRGLP
jgi:hypothetical protein